MTYDNKVAHQQWHSNASLPTLEYLCWCTPEFLRVKIVTWLQIHPAWRRHRIMKGYRQTPRHMPLLAKTELYGASWPVIIDRSHRGRHGLLAVCERNMFSNFLQNDRIEEPPLAITQRGKKGSQSHLRRKSVLRVRQCMKLTMPQWLLGLSQRPSEEGSSREGSLQKPSKECEITASKIGWSSVMRCICMKPC
ncbi:hypothetical protein BDW59DRAFT_127585 [Aspergillus cavernicola]|uniref:Uncharacterized protein n=1 Tax=Aspergillus cavernicola TaxID=176166 RepID=A0ABR4HUT1_9EURO